MNRLENKTALVTGGSTGIGFETAKAFLAEGAKVIITGRNQDKLNKAVDALGAKASGILSDASDFDNVSAFSKLVLEHTSILDIIYLNAGHYSIIPFEENTETYFDEMYHLYNKGVYFTIQKLLPLMHNGGSVILTNTISESLTMPGFSALITQKGAAKAMARTLANELAIKKIRVNTISPGGIIDTPGANKTISMAMNVSNASPEQVEAFSQQLTPGIPMKRLGKAREVAQAVVFLASDESSYITGIDLVVDGGKSIAW